MSKVVPKFESPMIQEDKTKDLPKETQQPKKVRITSDLITRDLETYQKYCSNEKNTGLCESYVKTFNENKQKSREIGIKTTRSIFWVIAVIGIVVLIGFIVYWIITNLLSLNLGDMLQSIFESMIPDGGMT